MALRPERAADVFARTGREHHRLDQPGTRYLNRRVPTSVRLLEQEVAVEGGWVACGPQAGADPRPRALRPELADVGRLVRRGLRAIVGAARANKKSAAVPDPRRAPRRPPSHDVVEETWPGLRPGQRPGRARRLAGRPGRDARAGRGRERLPAPRVRAGRAARPPDGRSRAARDRATAATINLACGPDGEVRPCVRCGLYLVTEGDRRTAVLLRGAGPEYGSAAGRRCRWSAPSPDAAPRRPRRSGLALEHNVFRGQVLSFGGEMFGHGQTLLRFHRRPDAAARTLVLPAGVLADGASGRSSGSPGTRTGCSRPASTSSAACCSTGRRAPARRTPCAT